MTPIAVSVACRCADSPHPATGRLIVDGLAVAQYGDHHPSYTGAWTVIQTSSGYPIGGAFRSDEAAAAFAYQLARLRIDFTRPALDLSLDEAAVRAVCRLKTQQVFDFIATPVPPDEVARSGAAR